MDADESAFELIFPICRCVRIRRLDIDAKKHFRLRAATHHFQQLFKRRDELRAVACKLRCFPCFRPGLLGAIAAK